jgi:hypothetical protein
MISNTALATAKIWCHADHRNFDAVERACLGYLTMNADVAGPYASQTEADRAFLSLVRAELDHADTSDAVFDRHRAVWASA